MTTLDSLKDSWRSEGLLDKEGRFAPTFIEDVGTASAENVRSAALMRWAKRNPKIARDWLEGILHESVGELQPSREVQIGKEERTSKNGVVRSYPCRIDLQFVPQGSDRRILAEVKWQAQPSIDQLYKYIRALGDSDTRIILITPIDVAESRCLTCPDGEPAGWREFPREKVIPVIWSSLTEYMNESSCEEGSVQESKALAATIRRWTDLYDAVGQTAKERDIHSLITLMTWMSSIEHPSDDYSILLKQLILAKLAEESLSVLGANDWIRSDSSKGAHGSDITVDLFHKRNSFYRANSDKHGYGVLVSIRFRIVLRKVDPVIQLQIGSESHPYMNTDPAIVNRLGAIRSKLPSLLEEHYRPTHGKEESGWRHHCSVEIRDRTDLEEHLPRMANCLNKLKQECDTI